MGADAKEKRAGEHCGKDWWQEQAGQRRCWEGVEWECGSET